MGNTSTLLFPSRDRHNGYCTTHQAVKLDADCVLVGYKCTGRAVCMVYECACMVRLPLLKLHCKMRQHCPNPWQAALIMTLHSQRRRIKKKNPRTIIVHLAILHVASTGLGQLVHI